MKHFFEAKCWGSSWNCRSWVLASLVLKHHARQFEIKRSNAVINDIKEKMNGQCQHHHHHASPLKRATSLINYI